MLSVSCVLIRTVELTLPVFKNSQLLIVLCLAVFYLLMHKYRAAFFEAIFFFTAGASSVHLLCELVFQQTCENNLSRRVTTLCPPTDRTVSPKSSQAHVDNCRSPCLGVIYHSSLLPSPSFHPLPTSLNQPLSLQRSSKKKKMEKKATVSPKPHSARRAAEPVWKSLSHWVYFSSVWPGLLALGSFRSDFGRRQTVISPLIHFNQQ